MNNFAELMKYVLPAVVVLITAVWLSLYFLKQERWRLSQTQKVKTSAMLLKIRLQAYERILLFLERIRPEQLVMRLSSPDLTATDLQRLLLGNIREEYEHNLVQQLYVSQQAWQLVNQSRSWVVKMVNDAAGRLSENSTGNDLAIAIIELQMAAKEDAISSAINILKKEVSQFF